MDDIRSQVMARAADFTPAAPEKNEIDLKFVRDCFWNQEMGDSILYTMVHKDKLFYNRDSKRWYEWNSNSWETTYTEVAQAGVERVNHQYIRLYESLGASGSDEDLALMKPVRKRIDALRTLRRRNAVFNYVTSNLSDYLSIKDTSLDSDPYLFACKNGVIDVRTGNLINGRQDQYITHSTDVEYRGLDDTNKDWERVVWEVVGEDESVAGFFRRFCGYACLGIPNEKIFLILNGRGWNGKGLLIETLYRVFGGYSIPIASEMLLDQKNARDASAPNPAIMELKGVRFAFASETDDGSRFSASKVKWLSGGDTLRGRYLYGKETVYFNPTHTLVLLTNAIPYANASDYAFWERAKIINFPFSYVERPENEYERPIDKHLFQKLIKNKPGILSWIIRGAIEYQHVGLSPPDSVLSATREQREDEDTIQIWIDECCDLSNKLIVTPLNKLHDHFCSWWKDTVGTRPPGRRTWSKSMKAKGFESHKKGVYHFTGIALKYELHG